MAEDFSRNGLTTYLDEILDIIKKKKKVKIRRIAKRLGIPKSKVLEYCEIMEEEGLIELKYPLIGSPLAEIREEAE